MKKLIGPTSFAMWDTAVGCEESIHGAEKLPLEEWAGIGDIHEENDESLWWCGLCDHVGRNM